MRVHADGAYHPQGSVVGLNEDGEVRLADRPLGAGLGDAWPHRGARREAGGGRQRRRVACGKGTLTDFIRGPVGKADLLYEGVDWPMQSQLQRQLRADPGVGLVVLDNVRLDSAGGRARLIRSAFLEGLVTSAELTLASPGAGEPLRLANAYLVVLSTNDGRLSPDLLDRSLPIQDRKSPIGDPKLEFLPAHRERIQAELLGMVRRWQEAGRPLDETVRHPMSVWARTVGGILRANGFTDFLATYAGRKAADDPTREALAVLAAARPGQALRPGEWAGLAVEEGLARALLPATERDSERGRERAVGVLLSRHLGETFEAVTEDRRLHVRLEGGFRRWARGKNPHVRYAFTVLAEEPLPPEEGPGTPPACDDPPGDGGGWGGVGGAPLDGT